MMPLFVLPKDDNQFCLDISLDQKDDEQLPVLLSQLVGENENAQCTHMRNRHYRSIQSAALSLLTNLFVILQDHQIRVAYVYLQDRILGALGVVHLANSPRRPARFAQTYLHL
jgi:hypothetical protein